MSKGLKKNHWALASTKPKLAIDLFYIKTIYLFSYSILEIRDANLLGDIFRFSFNSYNLFLNIIFSHTVNIILSAVARPGNPLNV